jgi:hypothetical protein
MSKPSSTWSTAGDSSSHRTARAFTTRSPRRSPGSWTSCQQPEFIFNYRSDESLLWNAGVLKDRQHYTATYPAEADNGTMSVDLLG